MLSISGLIFSIGGVILFYAVNGDWSFDNIDELLDLITAFPVFLIIGGITLTIGGIIRSNDFWKLRSSTQTSLDGLSEQVKKLEEQIKKLNNEKS